MRRKAESPLVGVLVLLLIATMATAVVYIYFSGWAGTASRSYVVQAKVINASFREENGNKTIIITVLNTGSVKCSIVAVLINGESVEAEPLPVSLGPGDAVKIKAYYDWEAGEGYKIEVITDSGLSFYNIFVALSLIHI